MSHRVFSSHSPYVPFYLSFPGFFTIQAELFLLHRIFSRSRHEACLIFVGCLYVFDNFSSKCCFFLCLRRLQCSVAFCSMCFFNMHSLISVLLQPAEILGKPPVFFSLWLDLILTGVRICLYHVYHNDSSGENLP